MHPLARSQDSAPIGGGLFVLAALLSTSLMACAATDASATGGAERAAPPTTAQATTPAVAAPANVHFEDDTDTPIPTEPAFTDKP